MAGTDNLFTKKETILQSVKGKSAVAGINGDFYNTQAEGVPMGPQITSGQLYATPPVNSGLYSFALTQDNIPIVDIFDFQGTVIAKDGTKFELGGVNKTYYWDDAGTHSHNDGLFMYTNAWGQTYRSIDGANIPTEVLVQNGKITQIALDTIIDMIAPADGYILRASGKAADFVKGHLKVGDPLVANYQMIPHDASKQYDAKTFKMMIGGNTILVADGKPTYFTTDIKGFDGFRYRSRTAIGYSEDKKTAYLITADNSGSSKGLSLPEMQQFMIQAGVWRGMVLDGGGSTQMVARPLGEFDPKLVNQTETGSQRKVVNGVGVFSIAPKGAVKDLSLKGPSELFINEPGSYQIKAYDEYYNPVAMEAANPAWTSSAPIGSWAANVFTPTTPGQTKLTAKSGNGTATMDVQVIGKDQVASMKINSGDISISGGQSYKLPVTITTKSGVTREVPPALLQWQVQGIKGEVKDGSLQVGSLAGSQSAQVIATYDGFSTMMTLPIGKEKVWYDLDNTAVMTNMNQYPSEVSGSVKIAQTEAGNKNLELTYDFTKGTGTKALYAQFNGTNGAQIEGEPQYMRLKVLGDESMNWLRAEIVDNAGTLHRVDLTQNMNWKGWKEISENLTNYNMKYPITIKSIYVANPEQGQDERALTGKINLDDITFIYKGELTALPKNKVTLTVNKKTALVNKQTMTLEQAPVIIKDNTMIPIRFVTEALGGDVKWNEAERKVTIVRGEKLLELWIDQADVLVNGQRITAEVAPKIMNNLTVVPLRLISEQLGWKVGWEPKGQVITLE
ncbi:hypothetical protein D3C73_444870 [compost metagenome]